jgi:alanyl-tRNA synthetase
MPLRKMPVVEGPVRIVQVSGFDWSPCGGTHVSRTGQVGPIKVTHVERRKDVSRVYFLCGWRALADYAHKQQVVGDLTAHLTTSDDGLLPSVERLEAEGKRLRKALSEAQASLLEHEVAAWQASADALGRLRVVRQVFEDRGVNVLREAARRLTEENGFVALLAVAEPRPQLVFASSEDVAADMGQMMRSACEVIGGKGGGRTHLAQGGAPEGALLAQALDEAVRLLEAGGKEGS